MVSRHEIAGLSPSDLLASHWALRIRGLAAPALHVMNARGRFSDQDAETEPSGPRVDLHAADHAPVAEIEIPFGTVVESTVVCHHQFGMGVWVAGHDQFGHVNVPAIRDGRIRSVEDFPPIGTRIRAVVLGYSGSRQLRLSSRPSDLPRLTEHGKALLRQIAEAVGAGDVDVDDEHARWWVYRDAVPREDLRVLLKEIACEGEKLSRQVVLEVLRYVDESEGRTWVELLPQGQDRDFAERRLREWALIREVVERPRGIVDDLTELTPWCQRRLIERVASDLVLSDLAERGSSKKIRHAAREKRAGRWTGWAP
jgi:predicted RNA-binding protein with RPS1 domain